MRARTRNQLQFKYSFQPLNLFLFLTLSLFCEVVVDGMDANEIFYKSRNKQRAIFISLEITGNEV